MKIKVIIFLASLGLCGSMTYSCPAWSCGRALPNRILIGGDEALMWAPLATFSWEFKKIAQQQDVPFKYVPADNGEYWRQTTQVDQQEFQSALRALGLPKEQISRLYIFMEEIRSVLQYYGCIRYRTATGHVELSDKIIQQCGDGRKDYPSLKEITVPPEFPPEFRYYLQGAIYYYQMDYDSARKQWLAVLDLPPGQRRHRSTWAAYMLGKISLDKDLAEAVKWFKTVREMAKDGYLDQAGLSAETFFLQARTESWMHRNVAAIENYVYSYAVGYEREPNSLGFGYATDHILQSGPEALAEAARSPIAREVISAVIASRCHSRKNRGPSQKAEIWLSTLEKAKMTNLRNADLLALAAYNNGRMDLARRWISRCRRPTDISLYVQAKLAMRHGRLRTASRLLGRASRMPLGETNEHGAIGSHIWSYYGISGLNHTRVTLRQRAWAEKGAIDLVIGGYAEALDDFLRASQGAYS